MSITGLAARPATPVETDILDIQRASPSAPRMATFRPAPCKGVRPLQAQRCKTSRMPLMPVLALRDSEDQPTLQAWVDVEVGGATVRLLLDTGSGTTAIPW